LRVFHLDRGGGSIPGCDRTASGNRDLAINDVVHKAFVSVDEAGTEAAAATAVIIKLTAAPTEPVKVTIDRPFIFAIRDIQTNSLLFVGRAADPGA